LQIAQVYVNFPASSGEPPAVLRGFTHVALRPGEKKTVVVTLSRYSLSVWDVQAQGWRRPESQIGVSVGASSRDVRLVGEMPVPVPAWTGQT
jgi:hypothetical protein